MDLHGDILAWVDTRELDPHDQVAVLGADVRRRKEQPEDEQREDRVRDPAPGPRNRRMASSIRSSRFLISSPIVEHPSSPPDGDPLGGRKPSQGGRFVTRALSRPPVPLPRSSGRTRDCLRPDSVRSHHLVVLVLQDVAVPHI
jgi:hypothetical protein